MTPVFVVILWVADVGGRNVGIAHRGCECTYEKMATWYLVQSNGQVTRMPEAIVCVYLDPSNSPMTESAGRLCWRQEAVVRSQEEVQRWWPY